MCDQLGIARQGYYRWRATGGQSLRDRADAKLTGLIEQIHADLHTAIPACGGSGLSWSPAGSGPPANACGG